MLNICRAVHDCCVREGIKYSIAYGTLLGAHRHGGFIPWDDDFDIMMTRADFEKFMEKFHDDRYKCITCYNNKQFTFPFARVIDTTTYSLSNKVLGKRKKGPGACIDLYIVDDVPEDKGEQAKLMSDVRDLVRQRGKVRKVMNLLAKLHLRWSTDYFPPLTKLCRKQFDLQKSFQGIDTKDCICFSGGPANKIVLPKRLFDEYVICDFEDRKFMAIADYDKFLTDNYGDWMTPPPKEKQVFYHGAVWFADDESVS